MKEFSVVFICQPGELEIKAALLAASLRQNWGYGLDLHCGIPEILGTETLPMNHTIDFLESLDTKIHKFKNPIINNEPRSMPGSKFSNKLFCFPKDLKNDRVLFLDSDIICLKKPDLHNTIESEFASCQAFRSLNLNWKELYSLTEIPDPGIRVKSILDGKTGPPYFNSGVFTIATKHLGLFLSEWQRLFQFSRELLKDEKHLHHSDQISLSLAVQKLELSYEILPKNYNFPSGNYLADENSYFAHYHGPEKILRDPLLYRTTVKLANKYPDIVKIAGNYHFWKEMISESWHPVGINLYYKLRKIMRKVQM
ncbi:hypothetical protein ACFLTA_02965 [Bacteroidota bacterium]